MQKHGKAILAVVCLLLFTFFLLQMGMYRVLKQELPPMVEWYRQDGFDCSVEALTCLCGETQTGFFVEQMQPVSDGVQQKEDSSRVRFANASYYILTGKKLRAGSWQEVTQQRAVAVSDMWALSHYKYLDVTGQYIYLSGRKYRIAAVYASRGSWIEQLSQDGADVIYTGFDSRLLLPDWRVQYLYFPKNGDDFSVNTERLSAQLARVCGMRAEPERVLDMESVRHVLFQNLVLASWSFLMLGALYFFSRTRNVLQYVLLFFVLVLPVAYQWYIPPAYVPSGQIFDISGYIMQYMTSQSERNFLHETGFYGNLAQLCVCISWGVLLFWAFMLLLLMVIIRGRRFLYCFRKKYRKRTPRH